MLSDFFESAQRWHVEHADCLSAFRFIPEACADAIITDPPYSPAACIEPIEAK